MTDLVKASFDVPFQNPLGCPFAAQADEALLSDVVSQVKQLGERNGHLSEEEIAHLIKKVEEVQNNE